MILTTYLTANVRTQSNQSILTILHRNKGESSCFGCRIEAPFTLASKFSDEDSFMKSLNLKGKFTFGDCTGYLWNSSSLLPKYYPSTSDIENVKKLSVLGKLCQIPSFQRHTDGIKRVNADFQRNDGLPLSNFSPELQNQILGSCSGFSILRNLDDLHVSTNVQVSIAFGSKSGGPYHEYFFKKGKFKGKVSLGGSASKFKQVERVPARLKRVLGYSVDVGNGGKVFHLGSLIDGIRKELKIPMYCDRRVAEDQIFIFSRYKNLRGDMLAELLANTMNMYWREVGNVYELASSPGDPQIASQMNYFAKSEKDQAKFFDLLESNNLVPPGLSLQDLLDNVGESSDLTQDSLQEMANNLDFKSEGDREKFLALFNDPSFQNGWFTTMIDGSLDVFSPSKRTGDSTEVSFH